MTRLAHQLVATMLAALFAVVGGAGQSLYYLFEAQPEPPAEQVVHQHAGYFHHHGDGLWHHHGPPQSSEASAPTANPDAAQTSDEHGAIQKDLQHPQHSCLALALIAKIQHSLANKAAAHRLADYIAPGFDATEFVALRYFQSELGARGPPLSATA